jgi:hypothetical protein
VSHARATFSHPPALDQALQQEFYIHGSVHHKSILIMAQRDAAGCSLFYFTAKNTLHVSGASNTHHQEYIKL